MIEKNSTIKTVANKAKSVAGVGAAIIGMNTTSPIDSTAEKYAKESYKANIVENARRQEIDGVDKATPGSSSK